MVLILDATGAGAGHPARRFEAGGTIGREAGNDWVLDDLDVSRHHAVIEYRGGAFFIRDRSSNGTFLNARRLPRDQPAVLASGDVVRIGPYKFRVTLEEGSRPASRGPRPPIRPVPDPGPREDVFSLDTPAGLQPADEDVLRSMGFESPVKVPPSKGPEIEFSGPEREYYRPPNRVDPPASEGVAIPAGYDPLHDHVLEAPASLPPAGPATPVPTPSPSALSSTEALDRLLAAAGLTGVAATPEVADRVGEILHVVVTGLMSVLQARQQVKDEFRMRTTRFEPTQNNALKFSADAAHALRALLVDRHPAYMAPAESFEDAFHDLRAHQLALLAGMRAAFESMLDAFDPQRLEADFSRAIARKKSLLGTTAEARYWELYRARMLSFKDDSEAAFQKLFGDAFVKAYEAQLDRLASRPDGPRE